MNSKKILCLVLAAAMLILSLCACGDSSTKREDGGDRTGDSWEGVDFGGEDLVVSISGNHDEEVTFQACDVYMRGSQDKSIKDSVLKKVKTRNDNAAKDLGLNIVYEVTDLRYDKVLEDIEKQVNAGDEDSPDIYNNDMYGLNRAMLAGYLWNVKNPGTNKDGDPAKSYFDFKYDGWMLDFMKGCTFDQNKLYLLAGDYFLDILRMAWVIYVNQDLFNQNIDAFKGLGVESLDDFYEIYVAENYWDYAMLTDMARLAFHDNPRGDKRGIADPKDDVVGLAINHVSTWIFASSSGIYTNFYQDKKGVPHVRENANDLMNFADAYKKLYFGGGVYYETEVLSSTTYFMQGNFLFAISVMGELESVQMREFSIRMSKGLVPVPSYDFNVQERYHTMVHDQTEIGAILVSASSFGAASAFLQYMNENSKAVLTEYYNESLKFKYSDGSSTVRLMIDLIHDTIDSPFCMQFAGLITSNYSMASTFEDAAKEAGLDYDLSHEGSDTIRAYYDSVKVACGKALEEMLAAFAILD